MKRAFTLIERGGVGWATGNPRRGILAIIVLSIAGGALLLRVRTGAPSNGPAGQVSV